MTQQKNTDTLVEKFNFLIVDDHDFMRHLIQETLRASGAGIIEKASNGEEAMAILARIRRVDFIITDFNMPKVNGLELLKAIRVGVTGVDRTTPVIMLSGFEDEMLLSTALALDAHGFIAKPVSKKDLVERLNTIFMREAKLKETKDYRSVDIPVIEGEFDKKVDDPEAMRPRPHVSQALKVLGEPIPIENVRPGSLIVNDVTTASGVILVHEGYKATRQLLEFLDQTKEITQISELVVVPKGADELTEVGETDIAQAS